MTHECAQAGCREDATTLVIEGHPLAMLFTSGAGLVCGRHAREFGRIGGVAVSLSEVAALSASEPRQESP